MFSLKLTEFQNACDVYVPESYDPTRTYGLLVWLHPHGGEKRDALLNQFGELCRQNDLILIAPSSTDSSHWQRTELAVIRKAIEEIRGKYQVDPARIVCTGREGGGSMALLAATQTRDLVRGVVAIDAGLQIRGRSFEGDPVSPLAVYLANQRGASAQKSVEQTADMFKKAKFPVTQRSFEAKGPDWQEIARWIDCLDRL